MLNLFYRLALKYELDSIFFEGKADSWIPLSTERCFYGSEVHDQNVSFDLSFEHLTVSF